MKKIQKAFTIIEVLIAIVIVSMILIAGFQAYIMILAGKVKLIERTKLQKEAFFFSERLFQMVKSGGTLDYEEYFNRKVIEEKWAKKIVQNGHYSRNTGFWNFGFNGEVWTTKGGLWYPYLCRSGNGEANKYNPEKWCYKSRDLRLPTFDPNGNKNATDFKKPIWEALGRPQRYGQYALQAWDYNGNYNPDGGDENNDLQIQWDDDDTNTGMLPKVFNKDENVHELYLLSGNKKVRTFFRWKFEPDPDRLKWTTCNESGWDWCLWTIQFLRLEGRDWWWDNTYSETGTGPSENDGIIDTWVIAPEFRSEDCKSTNTGTSEEQPYIAGQMKNMEKCRKDLFPKSLNVSDFKVFAYPNKNQKIAWKTPPSEMVSPYVILSLEIQPSYEINKKIRWKIPPLRFNTMINLTEIFSK